MKDYIKNKLCSDIDRLISASKAEKSIGHKHTRGRFRELLVNELLSPWLPAYVGCGSGIIIDIENRVRNSTQEDIVIFDRSIIPIILASQMADEGVFPIESVLARIEVKSKLTSRDLKKAIIAAIDIQSMKPARTQWKLDSKWVPPRSYLFAFDSDLKSKENAELLRFIKTATTIERELGIYCNNTPFHGICVVGKGCWIFGAGSPTEVGHWYKSRHFYNYGEIILFVGVLSNTCFNLRTIRHGRKLSDSCEMGIGPYILENLVEPAFPSVKLAYDLGSGDLI